jgi:predicted enzyme related to lactoylglutathione lyase
MASIEHFEIPADDVGRAQAFYTKVFGFTYEPWGDDMGMLMTGADGINGDIHQRGIAPHPTVVITVDSLEDTLAAVVAAGGEQVGEIEAMSDDMRYVYFKDTEGNIIGAVWHR